MIDIEIYGIKSKKKKQLFTDACHFYIKALLPRHRNMTLDLYFESDLNADGVCSQVLKKYIVIDINKDLPIVEQLKTLAHEMVHCKQYLRKELSYSNNNVIWKGSPYFTTEFVDELTSDKKNSLHKNNYDIYFETPWEKEAYYLEIQLYKSFETIYLETIKSLSSKDFIKCYYKI